MKSARKPGVKDMPSRIFEVEMTTPMCRLRAVESDDDKILGGYQVHSLQFSYLNLGGAGYAKVDTFELILDPTYKPQLCSTREL